MGENTTDLLAPAGGGDNPDPADPDDLGEAGKKALDAERRTAKAAARERDALAARLKEIEDKDKSETQRLVERAETAERKAADAELRALRVEVGAEYDLDPYWREHLVGATREELQANAKQMLDHFPNPGAPAEPADPRRAVADNLDLGVRGAPPKNGKTNADLFAAAVEPSFTR
jgi:hypothetical protein